MYSRKAVQYQILPLVFSIFSLVSCTATPFSNQAPQRDYLYKVNFLSAQTGALLENATVGQSFVMPQGPLPQAAQVQVIEQYFSASGRRCLHVVVETAQSAEPMLFCRYGPQEWGATRALPKTLKPSF
jgi:hypothetical protein